MKYFVTTHLIKLIIATVAIFCITELNAQETGVSPYSRIGLGDVNRSHSPAYASMGGAAVSLSDFNLVNMSNPASLSFLSPHMPVFEMSGATQFLELSSANSSANLTSTNFTRMSIGIPVNRKLGLALGVKPFTTTGYDITTTNSEPAIGNVTYNYKGKGGVNNLFLSGGYALLKSDSMSLSLGGSVNFLFGNSDKTRRVEFPEDETALNSMLTQKTSYNGIDFQLGLLFKQRVSSKMTYSIGASYSIGTKLNATREDFFGTYTNFSATEVVQDTLQYFADNEGKVTIPSALSLGASVNFNKNLDLSVQYNRQDWSNFDEAFDQQSSTDTLATSSSFAVGVRYRPTDVFATAKFYERIEYRVGFKTGNTSLQFNNNQLTEFGTSFGLGIPLRKSATSKNEFRSLSMLNIGVETGRRGNTDNGLIQESFTTVYFGISIMPQVQNRWFVKRKFK